MVPSPPTAPAFLDAEVRGQKHEVRLDVVCRVGRNVGNDLVLDSESVSRHHALVYATEPGVYYVNDLGSSNGTLVNGSRISAPTPLKDGDQITFGSYAIQFRQRQATSTRPVGSDTPTNMIVAQKQITVLVSDIRGFSALSRRLDAATIAKINGALFRQAGRALHDCGAWTQKYIGDAVMAVWLHSDAIQIEMSKVLTALSRLAKIVHGLQPQFGLENPVRVGAGINTGFASVGNLGSAAVPDYTALGDAVNRAFHLETATKEIGCDVLFGDQTYQLLEPFTDLRAVLRPRTLRLKGSNEDETAWAGSFQDVLPALEAIALPVAKR